jgi:hypothetical protein
MSAVIAFPIVVRFAPHHLEELRESEHPSWEDHQERNQTFEGVSDPVAGDPARYGRTHAYDILGRHPGRIEMRDLDEVAEIYYSAASGTFQIDRTDEEDPNQPGVRDRQYRAACRLCDRLRPYIVESHSELVHHWTAPSGC